MINRNLAAIFCLFFLFSCAEKNIQQKELILNSIGKGETEQQAQNSAVANLSNQIFVNIESALQSEEVLKNDQFNISVSNTLKLNSKSYFQGLVFYNLKKLNSRKYEVYVGIDEKSIISTISYLFVQINPSEFDSLSRDAMMEKFEKANFLLSLVYYAKSKNIPTGLSGENLITLKQYIADLDMAIKSNATVKFLVIPNLVDVKLLVDSKPKKPYQNIYLSVGNHSYEASLSGYRSVSKSFNLSLRDNIQYTIHLQKKLITDIPVSIIINNRSGISDSELRQLIEKVAINNQMYVVDKSENHIEVDFSKIHKDTSLKNFAVNIIDVTFKVLINGKKQGTSVSIKYLAKEGTEEIPTTHINKQLDENLGSFLARIYD